METPKNVKPSREAATFRAAAMRRETFRVPPIRVQERLHRLKLLRRNVLKKFRNLLATKTFSTMTTQQKTTGGPTTTLSNGVTMPLLGLGTWKSKVGQLVLCLSGKNGGAHLPTVVGLCGIQGGDVSGAVELALQMGYRHIDTAQMYGNHADIGKVFAKMLGSDLKRGDVFITSKVSGLLSRLAVLLSVHIVCFDDHVTLGTTPTTAGRQHKVRS